MMERYLAHRIVYRGKTYPLSVLTLTTLPDGSVTVGIEPFGGETASTSFHSGTITVTDTQPPRLIFS